MAEHTWVTAGFDWTSVTATTRTWSTIPITYKGVVSDLVVRNDTLPFASFQTMVQDGKPASYTDFKTFIQGDYDYRKAIYRVIMESATSDRASLSELRVVLDVPDVFDSGSATITVPSTGVNVTFTQTFHTVPEITVSLKGGTVLGIVDFLTPTKTGFTGIIRDPSSGARIAGSFTWTAHGY